MRLQCDQQPACDAIIAAIGSRELVIGGVAIHLQDSAITIEMADRAFTGAAVFEAISHHRGTVAAKRSIIPGIGP
ncbi:hypothetical protein BRDID11002_17750 [Bradyrhizobium diazoefficiens]